MIVEQRKWLKWVRYADCQELSPNFFTVYRAASCKKCMFGFKRVEVSVMQIDLDKPLDSIFQQFQPELRRQIRKAMKENLRLWQDQDYNDVIKLFNLTAKEKGLRGVSMDLLSTKGAYWVTHVSDEQLGGVAAHYYHLDPNNRIAFLDYNCSAFRNYTQKQDKRKVAAANKLLFWFDIKSFKEAGYRILDFGDFVSAEEDEQLKGVYEFKRPFNGKVELLYDYTPYWLYITKKIKNAIRYKINRI